MSWEKQLYLHKLILVLILPCLFLSDGIRSNQNKYLLFGVLAIVQAINLFIYLKTKPSSG